MYKRIDYRGSAHRAGIGRRSDAQQVTEISTADNSSSIEPRIAGIAPSPSVTVPAPPHASRKARRMTPPVRWRSQIVISKSCRVTAPPPPVRREGWTLAGAGTADWQTLGRSQRRKFSNVPTRSALARSLQRNAFLRLRPSGVHKNTPK